MALKNRQKSKLIIQPRDIEIFEWLYQFRFLTAQQIAQLVDPVREIVTSDEYKFRNGQASIIKRVYLLAQEDNKGSSYLKCTKQKFKKYVYSLGRKAIDVLALEKGMFKDELEPLLRTRKWGEEYLEHKLMIAEFGASLAIACKELQKQGQNIELITWLNESQDYTITTHIPEELLTKPMQQWKKPGEIYGLKLEKRPDAIFILQNPQGKQAWFMLEAERGTKTSQRFLREMAAYYYFLTQQQFEGWSQDKQIHHQGRSAKNFGLIVYTINPQKQASLIKTILNINPQQTGSKMFWFTNQGLLKPDQPSSIFKPIFTRGQQDELSYLYSLLGQKIIKD